MKIKLLSAFFMLFTAIGFVSCDTEPVDPVLVGEDPTENTPASFEVDFNNQTYQATTVQAVVLANAAAVGNNIVITAVKSDGSTFVITVPGTTTGTYTNAQILYAPALGAADAYYNVGEDGALNGSVTIASINTTTHKITGTFAFTGIYTGVGQPDIAFTNGIFTNIAYTGTITPVEPTDSFFRVDYDGATYTADSYYASVGHSLIDIMGYRGTNGEYVSISVYGTTVGTYTGSQIFMADYFSGDEDGGNSYAYTNDYNNDDVPMDITVTISEIDQVNHIISGTFSFTGIGSGEGTGESVNGELKTFTNGQFSVPYITNDPEGVQFNATVDGTAYNYSVDFTGLLYTGVTGFGAEVIGPGHRIEIWSDAEQGVGSYPITYEEAPSITTNRATYWDAAGVEYHITEGTINITSTYYDAADGVNYAEGTFSFVVKNDAGQVIHTVTNGSFKLDYEGE